jgi:hypothetical protein
VPNIYNIPTSARDDSFFPGNLANPLRAGERNARVFKSDDQIRTEIESVFMLRIGFDLAAVRRVARKTRGIREKTPPPPRRAPARLLQYLTEKVYRNSGVKRDFAKTPATKNESGGILR